MGYNDHNKRSPKDIDIRADRRRKAIQILHEHGIKYTVHNRGAHIIIHYLHTTIDYWPGTGKWRDRVKESYERGIFNLLKYLENINKLTYIDKDLNEVPLPEEF